MTLFAPVESPLDDFIDKHPDWQKWFHQPQPVYAIPLSFLPSIREAESERRAEGSRYGVFTDQNLSVETSFAKMANNWVAFGIGVWRGRSIAHHLLAADEGGKKPHPFNFNVQWQTGGHWGDDQRTEALKQQMNEFPNSQRGGLGALLTHEPFRREVLAVREYWERLPTSIQHPILATTEKSKWKHITKKHEVSALVEFQDKYRELLTRWALLRFETWDLPVPVPPLLGFPVSLAQQFLPANAEIDYWPPLFELPNAEDMAAFYERRQRTYAERYQLGIKLPIRATSRKRGSESDSEKIFQMRMIEIACRQRYGERRGLSKCLSLAFEKHFALAANSVKSLRRRYVSSLPAK